MTTTPYRPLVHRTALATTIVALLPIGVGALVTSMGAGMAFRDWPSSDGQFMLTYPWLADLVRGAVHKFVEHGHRLAGMLIGVTSILLMAVVWRFERRNWVRGLATGVFACVVVQGLLGGGRVLADDPRWAMVHGNFAAIVFCLMGTLCVVTSRRWIDRTTVVEESWRMLPASARTRAASATSTDAGSVRHDLRPIGGELNLLRILSVVTVVAVYGQFILGGRLRHLHDMLYEHLAGAVLVAVLVIATVVFAFCTRIGWIRAAAGWMLFFLLAQAALGAGAWVTKYGFATTGYVAVQGTSLQLALRSSHTVVGMLLLLSSAVLVLRVARLSVGVQASACSDVRETNAVCSTAKLKLELQHRLTAEGGPR
jgi:cytochrome c oxidase assembly protein subunit 15